MSSSRPFRAIPRVDEILDHPLLHRAQADLGRQLVRGVVDETLQRVRRGEISPADALGATVAALPETACGLHPVMNATGVIVHTNLGRAPLSEAARQAMQVAAGYTDVELDLATGQRGHRGAAALQAFRAAVPDAPAVHVVNNNAAALALIVFTLAAGREVVISRGEFVEIGDGFRIPELLTAAGARLREVGTTNRTRITDYAEAINDDTALILRIHPSNFTVAGFTGSVPLMELATLGLPVIHDIGSGLLHPDPMLPQEPDVTTSLRAGAALVTASADKLLGGPQAGVIFGHKDLIERLRRHPLARALRVSKLTLAALEATVRGPRSPVHEALHADTNMLRVRGSAHCLSSRGWR